MVCCFEGTVTTVWFNNTKVKGNMAENQSEYRVASDLSYSNRDPPLDLLSVEVTAFRFPLLIGVQNSFLGGQVLQI